MYTIYLDVYPIPSPQKPLYFYFIFFSLYRFSLKRAIKKNVFNVVVPQTQQN